MLARALAWVVAVPLGVVGAGSVVHEGQRYRQHRLETARAHAVLDEWAQAVAVVLTRVAVRPDAAATVQAREDTQSRSLRGVVMPDGWSLRPDGRTVTVLFSGADGPGDRPCGADYAARAVTSTTGVVVVLRQTSPAYWRQVGDLVALDGRFDACPAIAVARTVDVRLDAPLGGRTVLDVVTGRPLPRFPA